MSRKCLFIFTRDFRIIDNTTLNYVANHKTKDIIPFFLFTKKQIDKNEYFSNNSVECMCHGLHDVNTYLDNNLNICYGDYRQVLTRILNHIDFHYLAINNDITPFGIKRQQLLEKWCSEYEIEFISKMDYNLVGLNQILTKNKTPYQTFFHFYQGVKKIAHTIKPEKEIKTMRFLKIPNLELIEINDIHSFYKSNPNNIFLPFNRSTVLKKLEPKNLARFKDYAKARDFPRYDTTLLSAFIKYGLVSIREVYSKINDYFGSQSELSRQIVWREFYYYLMYHLPQHKTIGGSNMQEKNYEWVNNKTMIEAWKKGKTGFPFVDASMRQLNQCGWMHNRSRLCVANSLVYLFHCDWKIGEKYFAEKLADYDISQNNGNWQWCAGVGVDRKPYLRMYNPYTYIEKHDPDGVYIKRWCPELKTVDIKHLRKWDKYRNKYQHLNYPEPIVDYEKSREISKQIFLG